jgi:hypothetical protein
MPQGLWVEHKADFKTYIGWIPIKDCESVAQFIREVKEDTQFAIPKNAEITLCTLSGTTIDVYDSLSSLLLGNSSKNPLRIQVSGASNPVLGVNLTSFWNSLRGLSKMDGFLHLPVIPKFFPERMNAFYVRNAYEDLFSIICRNLKHENPDKRFNGMAITGTSGTKKSMFLFYIMGRLANMETTETVILRRQIDEEKIYVFQKDGCWVTSSISSLWGFLDNPTTWYLTDALLPPPGNVPAVTILVSSPSEKYYSDFLKYSSVSLLHYLPIWSLEELKLAAKSYSKSTEKVEERFNKIGGIPRYVLENDVEIEALIDEKMGRLLSSKANLPSAEGSGTSDISHRLVHFKVDPSNYMKCRLIMASRYVLDKFSDALYDKEEEESWRFLRMVGDIPAAASIAGIMFEKHAHRKLSAGGEFLVRSLDGELEKKMNFPSKLPQRFTSLSECMDPTFYYRLKARNFPCIDSLSLGIGYFQMTVSLEHKIPWNQMKAIKDIMKMDDFYFVVPHTKYKEFKKQEFKRGAKNSNDGDGGETSTEKEIFEENGGSSRNNKRRKIKKVSNNQILRENLIRQYVISIPIDEEMEGWINKADEQAMQDKEKKGDGKEKENGETNEDGEQKGNGEKDIGKRKEMNKKSEVRMNKKREVVTNKKRKIMTNKKGKVVATRRK